MNKIVLGLHHVTALASNPQENLDFYAGILGLRMIKRSINFDDPEVYHLYFGNEVGTPGTIMTFFPYEEIQQGKKGKGQLTVTSFSIPENAIDYWIKRFDKFKVSYKKPDLRFEDELVLYFEDKDGLGLELVANKRDERIGFIHGHIPAEFAIKGFYSIALLEEGHDKTERLLTTQMNHQLILEKENRFRYSTNGKPGTFVDVLCHPDALRGVPGYGTVHHVAFATQSDELQFEAREELKKKGFNPTPIIDRKYFHSVYFREPGGVLFEIATIAPGFTVDEELAHLGESLQLPSWEEKHRKVIEKYLSPLRFDREKYRD